jgi:osmoprotectant transport system permease protein
LGAESESEGRDLMHFSFSNLVHWFTSGQHWSGPDGIPIRVGQHLFVSAIAVAVALVIALPIGLAVGHRRRGEFIAVSVANIGRAVPSFAVLVLVFAIMTRALPGIAFGYGPGAIALLLLAIPPILTNTIVGVQSVDADTIEAARGMGMREREVLLRLELPLASGLILGGIRTAALQVVATATLIAVIGGGGLGRYIIDGTAQGDTTMTVAGAVLVAVLAIITELAMGYAQRVLTPRTASRLPTGAIRQPREFGPLPRVTQV